MFHAIAEPARPAVRRAPAARKATPHPVSEVPESATD